MVQLMGLLPIRKTAPDKVSLTSYYGKTFVTRGKRNADNYSYWLQTSVMASVLNPTNGVISEAVCDNVFDMSLKAPRIYSIISVVLKSCTIHNYDLLFDHKEVVSNYPPKLLSKLEVDGQIVIGRSKDFNILLVLDKNGILYSTNATNDLTPISSLEEFMGIDTINAPVEYSSASVFGKDIPVGVILGLELGLSKLMSLLNANPRRVEAGTRLKLVKDEYAISFSDESLVFDLNNKLASMILSGFNAYHKTLKLFSIQSFDKRGVYLNLLEANGLGVRFIREIDMANNMFVDPITRDILIEMKEPTTYRGLLFRASQMLLTDEHPQELDPAYMRIKGYERLSGAVYSEIIQSLRTHNASLGKSNATIQMNPYAVWKRISEDPAKLQSTEINPIASLKEVEAVTYGGVGGRSSLSMTKNTRGYHENDMGTISEATKDSADVAINIYTSANPNFTSLRGMSSRFDLKNPDTTTLLSTSVLLAPCSDRDDPRRAGFVSIQQEHAIACDGYHQFAVRTGYDSVLPHRTTDIYAHMAKKPGTVRQIKDTGIIVDYEDGSTGGFELGRLFGNSQGLTVAHHVVTPLKENEKFAVGEPIIYNDGFFEPDFFNSKQIVWKNAINTKTVLWESTQTLEDSSVISKELSSKLSTKITKVKDVLVTFEQAVSEMVKVGDSVVADSVLCIIEDAITANNKLFNEKSLQTLKSISAQTPRARVKGIVEKIEVFYHGDREDMSESLKELTAQSDKVLRSRFNSVGKETLTGEVDSGFRIENNPLALDQLVVRFYITSNVGAFIGDKAVFANQLKSCVGEVIEQDVFTESNEKVEAIFGYRSVEARIVNSPAMIGTTATLLGVVAKKAAALYRGTAK